MPNITEIKIGNTVYNTKDKRVDGINSVINTQSNLMVKGISDTVVSWPFAYNEGYLIKSDGQTWVADGYGTSEYIPVEPLTAYLIMTVSGSETYKWVSFYNSSKVFISGTDGTQTKTFTTPANTAYLTIGVSTESFGNVVVKLGEMENGVIVNSYSDNVYRSERQNRVNEFAVTSILNGKDNLALSCYYLKDYYRNSQGKDLVAEGWQKSDLIPVEASTNYVSNYTTFVCFYDSNNAFISSPISPGKSFITPLNCAYIVISYQYEQKDYMFIKGNTISSCVAKTIYVGATEEYTTIRQAVEYSNENPNTTIIIRPGTYDIISEYGGQGNVPGTGTSGQSTNGMKIGNGVTMIFEQGAIIECIYTAGDSGVEESFSIFNAIHPTGNSDYTIIGFTCRAKNIRYCIHDEMASTEIAYEHKYIDCNMYLDNTESSWSAKQCIGGGLGKNGRILVENCVFESHGADDEPAVSWHNHYMAGSKSVITIKDCYFIDGRIEFYNYGQQTENTICKVINNSALYPAQINGYEGAPEKIILYAWNNQIRS